MIGQHVGKYQILDRIGRGGMGTVYRAMDQMLQREVAIKVLNAELNDPEIARRFRAEAVTVARLNHPGIATIYELFEHEGQWLMVMEFVRGETLEHMVDRMGPLAPQRAAELCMQALIALAHAHSLGVVHRDLKPANLMVTDSGTVKIMDFGIARVSGSEHLTGVGFMMGTPAYMSPEQVMGHEIDSRADLYSMGVVFYRLSSGKLPFTGETPFAMAHSQVHDPPTPLGMQRSDLPAWADQVVIRALAKDREARFQSAVEFYEAFSRCLAGLPMTTQSAPIVPGPADATALGHTPARMPTGGSKMPTGGYGVRTPGPMGITPVLGSKTSPTPLMPDEVTSQAPAHRPPAAAPPRVAGAKRINTVTMALAGAVVVLLAAVVYVWQRGGPATPPDTPASVPQVPSGGDTAAVPPGGAAQEPPPPPVAAPPPVTAAAPPPPVPPAAGTAPPVPPASGRASGTPPSAAARGTGDPARGAGRQTPPPVTTPVAPPATVAPPPAAVVTPPAPVTPPPPAAPLAFNDVKVLVISGKKSTEQDVVASFSASELAITARRGGAAVATVAYPNVARATYVFSKALKFDPSLPAPAADLELPAGVLTRPTRHWLVIQTRAGFTVLRLAPATAAKAIEALETRAGIKVDRPAGEK
jgi:serine/threonine protein kinase